MGPKGGSMQMAARNPARTDSWLAVAAIAKPTMPREYASMNTAAHGLITRPSGSSTSMASCVWSASHHWFLNPRGRVR